MAALARDGEPQPDLDQEPAQAPAGAGRLLACACRRPSCDSRARQARRSLAPQFVLSLPCERKSELGVHNGSMSGNRHEWRRLRDNGERSLG